MRRMTLRVALCGAAALALFTGAQHSVRAAEGDGEAKQHGPIAWTVSLPNAMKTASKDKKVVMVDFWATWCGPCKQMLATTYKDKTVVEKSKQFVPVLVDVDKQSALARKYKVESIPTVIFMDGKGNVLGRSVGYAPASDFLKMMDDAKKKNKY